MTLSDLAFSVIRAGSEVQSIKMAVSYTVRGLAFQALIKNKLEESHVVHTLYKK